MNFSEEAISLPTGGQGEYLVLSVRGVLEHVREVVPCGVLHHMHAAFPEFAVGHVVDDPFIGNICGPSVPAVELAKDWRTGPQKVST